MRDTKAGFIMTILQQWYDYETTAKMTSERTRLCTPQMPRSHADVGTPGQYL